MVLFVVAACGSRTPPVEPAPPAPTPVEVTATNDASVPIDASMLSVALSAADCVALTWSRAVGVAVVQSRTSDCSGVGNHQIVLDVPHLSRGEGIQRIVTSRPMAGSRSAELAVGTTVLAAIEPDRRPAQTVNCVPLPDLDGTLRHAVEVDSVDTGMRVLSEIAAGRLCPRPGCPLPSAQALQSPTPIPGRKPHPWWAHASQEHAKGEEALAAGNHVAAAEHFMQCGAMSADLRDGTKNGRVAEVNAIACFDTAARIFAAAGVFAVVGRAELAPYAERKDPIGEHVRKLLASPPSDCAVPPRE